MSRFEVLFMASAILNMIQTYRCSLKDKRIRQLEFQRDTLASFVQVPLERLPPMNEEGLRRNELNHDFSKNRFDA